MSDNSRTERNTSGRPESATSGGWLDRLAATPAGSRLRWGFLLFWIAVIALTAPSAGRIGEVEDNGAQAFLPESSDSLRVLALQDQFDTGSSIAAVIVYYRESGLTSEDFAKIEAVRPYRKGDFGWNVSRVERAHASAAQ